MQLFNRAAPPAASSAALALILLPVLHVSAANAQSMLAPVWSGVYFGAHVGGAASDFESSLATRKFELEGFALGAHAGVNMQLLGFIVGVEADATMTDAAHTAGAIPLFSATSEIDWIGSVRGKLGYALGPFHIYATAGMAWTETTVIGQSFGTPFARSTELQSGIVYGAGLEMRVGPNISMRFEGLRYDFDTELHMLTGNIGGNTLDEILAVEPDFTVFRAGLSLYLN